MTRPDFWDDACRALSRRDKALARIIRACGPIHLVSRDDPFQSLARAIVGQQISVKAAASVWARVQAACGTVAPERVCRMRASTLRKAGLSERKVSYVKDLAARFRSGELDPAQWPAMDDESVIQTLVAVHGVGRWTAEMFLIFNLVRPDVYPVDDPGLLTALGRVYGDGQKFTRAEAIEIASRWQPWRTVATWYLWRSLDTPFAEPR